MSEDPPSEFNTLPPSSDRVDAACDRFEAGWRAALAGGPPPRIENIRGETLEPEGAPLLRELILLDRHYRGQRGELVRSYGEQALTALQQALANGYKDLAHLQKNKDLDPLRGREDFQKLLAELARQPGQEKARRK
jgi:hypothetical protein